MSRQAEIGELEVTILGCGTSTGVPVIGCECATCRSSHPGNQRTRSSAWLRFPDEAGAVRSILIDTSTDLRQQALREGIDRVDAVLYTHAHADHIFGLDDLRIFNFRQEQAIPCYASTATLATLRRTFAYVFEDGQEGGGKPKIDLIPIDGPFEVFGLEIQPIALWHGSLPVLGFRVGSFAYLTDCSSIPEESFARLEGVEELVLDALRYRPHPTHMNLDRAIETAHRIGAARVWFTHLACEIDASHLRQPLPEGMALARDGLRFTVSSRSVHSTTPPRSEEVGAP